VVIWQQRYIEKVGIVFHDNVRIDQQHIGMRTPKIFQVTEFFSVESGGSPIQNVQINGSYATDESGYYECVNLTYNSVYCFVVETPINYYPAWVLNVEGSFSYLSSGTYTWGLIGGHYLLYHNVTESQTGYLGITFYLSSQTYIQSSNGTIISSFYFSDTYYSHSEYIYSLSINSTSGSNTVTKFYSTKGKPDIIFGTSNWIWNSVTKQITINIVHSSSKTIQIVWINETPFTIPVSGVLYSGSFNLYLEQNGSIGSQLLLYYVAIQHLNVTALNTTGSILGKVVNDRYLSYLKFSPNIDGSMKILTNLNQSSRHHIIKVLINSNENFVTNGTILAFSNGDNITVFFEIANPVITETEINAIIGIIGVGLFCANPVLSYTLSDKAKDKFKFLFILMGVGIISLGLIFSFIYG